MDTIFFGHVKLLSEMPLIQLQVWREKEKTLQHESALLPKNAFTPEVRSFIAFSAIGKNTGTGLTAIIGCANLGSKTVLLTIYIDGAGKTS